LEGRLGYGGRPEVPLQVRDQFAQAAARLLQKFAVFVGFEGLGAILFRHAGRL
jgi:hypothetical protein